MNQLVTYFVEVSICLGIMSILYYYLFRKSSNFNFRRAILIGLTIASLSIPLIDIGYTIKDPFSSELVYTIKGVVINMETLILPEVVVEGNVDTGVNWIKIATVTYLVIAAILLIHLASQLARIYSIARRNPKEIHGWVRLVRLQGDHPTFSFFNYVFFNPPTHLSGRERDKIFEHEVAHSRQLHSLDSLFFEICRSLFWFHPSIWYLQSEIKNVHEYLADEEVARRGNVPQYTSLLSRLALESNSIAIGNYFNSSQTLNRLKMLTTQKRPLAKWKLGMATLMISLLFATFSCNEEVINDINSLDETLTQVPPPEFIAEELVTLRESNPGVTFNYFEADAAEFKKAEKLKSLDQNTIALLNVDKERGVIGMIISDKAGFEVTNHALKSQGDVLRVVDEPASPVDGFDSFYKYIMVNMKYPESVREASIEGKVYVSFTVNEAGEIVDVAPEKSPDPALGKEAVRVVMAADNWVPAKNEGKTVSQRIILPITFKLPEGEKLASISLDPLDENALKKEGVLSKVDEPATPTGGLKAFYLYLQENMKYPVSAKDAGIEGQVFVSFIVTTDGKLTEVAAEKSPDPALSKEAVRALMNSGDWIPAKNEGKLVNQRIILPISFKLPPEK